MLVYFELVRALNYARLSSILRFTSQVLKNQREGAIVLSYLLMTLTYE